jgi:hypothetical protein
MYGKNPADDVFIDVDAEGESDLLSDSLATPGWIAPFHLDNRVDQLFRRSFGARLTHSFR